MKHRLVSKQRLNGMMKFGEDQYRKMIWLLVKSGLVKLVTAQDSVKLYRKFIRNL